MAKDIKTTIKLQCPGGAATPAPPVGPALGQHGLNIAQFVKKFNDETRQWQGDTIPVVITVYADRTFDLEYKQPPASSLVKKSLGVEKGSGKPQDIIGELNKSQVEEIAKRKMPDLNAGSLEAAMRIIAGTARSMGIRCNLEA